MASPRTGSPAVASESVRCVRCGNEFAVGANFCNVCGAPRWSADTTRPGDLLGLAETLDADDELANAIASVPAGAILLVVRRGPNAPSRYLVTEDETLVGRHAAAEVFLDDITVSRRHACVRRTPAGFELDDLGSLNGTYVDGERVTWAALHHLAELRIGAFVLVVIMPGSADRATPED